jgi:hypothetical protein
MPKKIVKEVDNEDILVDGSFYKGNENLLRGNASLKWTDEMVEDLKLCRKSILHFAENHFYIITLDEGKTKIELYKFQKQLLKSFKSNRFNVVLASRQVGKSTCITMYALWLVCFFEDKRITIVANKADTAEEIFSRVKMAFEELPLYLKPSVKSWRKNGFVLANGSAIQVSTTSSAGPRGSTSNLLLIDEMAHCPNEVMKELWKSAIPIISSSKNSQIIVISTPNGTDNKFYELYEDAQKPDSEWNLEVVNWWDVPGRNEEWKKSTIAQLGSQEDFDQEFGNQFHASGKTVVDSTLLAELKAKCKDPILALDDGAYKIYNMPMENHFYVVGVDVSEGIGRSNTVAQILDVSDLHNIEQVAVYSNNQISPYLFGTRLMGLLNDWGRPPVLVENNNSGQQVLDVLGKIHNYENIVSYYAEGVSKQYKNDQRLGIHSHTNTKYRGTTNFRYWTNSLNALRFYDFDTLIEMNNFVQHPNYTYSKRTNNDLDDRVFALIWSLFILDPNIVEKYFYIQSTDDQGRPLSIRPLTDNSDLLKKSPLFYGTSTIHKRTINNNFTPLAYVGGDFDKGFQENTQFEMTDWLNDIYGDKEIENKRNQNSIKELSNVEEHKYPIVVF